MPNLLTDHNESMRKFTERLYEQVKGNIGELADEDMIKSLVNKAINEIFFKEDTDRYGKKYTTHFVQLVSEYAKPLIEAEVKKFVEEYKEELEVGIRNYLNEHNLTLLCIKASHQSTQSLIYEAMQVLSNDIISRMGRY